MLFSHPIISSYIAVPIKKPRHTIRICLGHIVWLRPMPGEHRPSGLSPDAPNPSELGRNMVRRGRLDTTISPCNRERPLLDDLRIGGKRADFHCPTSELQIEPAFHPELSSHWRGTKIMKILGTTYSLYLTHLPIFNVPHIIYFIMFLYQFNCFAVFIRWQLAHLTSHFSISF